MTWKEVGLLFSVLELRELLIAKLAILTGMRAGEIFALNWKHVRDDSIEIEQRVYRGKLDSPKTHRSIRTVALSDGLQALLREWKAVSLDTTGEAWVFACETGETPLSKDNCWRRYMAPKLKKVGLEWANFHVMRRTNCSRMKERKIDPKLVADQLGHSLDESNSTSIPSPRCSFAGRLPMLSKPLCNRRSRKSPRSAQSLNRAFWSRPSEGVFVSC
jgi:integrase